MGVRWPRTVRRYWRATAGMPVCVWGPGKSWSQWEIRIFAVHFHSALVGRRAIWAYDTKTCEEFHARRPDRSRPSAYLCNSDTQRFVKTGNIVITKPFDHQESWQLETPLYQLLPKQLCTSEKPKDNWVVFEFRCGICGIGMDTTRTYYIRSTLVVQVTSNGSLNFIADPNIGYFNKENNAKIPFSFMNARSN